MVQRQHLGAIAMLMLFLRLQRREHVGQLEETERDVFRESEVRFSCWDRAVNRYHARSYIFCPNQT